MPHCPHTIQWKPNQRLCFCRWSPIRGLLRRRRIRQRFAELSQISLSRFVTIGPVEKQARHTIGRARFSAFRPAFSTATRVVPPARPQRGRDLREAGQGSCKEAFRTDPSRPPFRIPCGLRGRSTDLWRGSRWRDSLPPPVPEADEHAVSHPVRNIRAANHN